MEKYNVFVRELSTMKIKEIEIIADEGESSENIILKVMLNQTEIVVQDYNYLPAFQKLRDIVLSMGYGFMCKGALINVVQSEMMGASSKIYLIKQGKQALEKDITNIYDYIDIDKFPNTQEQNDFLKKWKQTNFKLSG